MLFLRGALGFALATVFLYAGFLGPDVTEHVCGTGASFGSSVVGTASVTREELHGFPPRTTCHVYSRDGRELATETYPQTGSWLIALALFLSPFAIQRLYRRVRPRPPPPPPVTFSPFDQPRS